VPGENRDIISTAGPSFASVVRFSQPKANGENLGFISTNRFYMGGGSGHMNAITVRENVGQSWRYSGEYAWSYTLEPDTNWITNTANFGKFTAATDGESFHGIAASQRLTQTTRNWATEMAWDYIGQTFRADMGFMPINNRNNITARQRYIGRPNGERLKFYQISSGFIGAITPQSLWKNQLWNTEYTMQFAGNFSTGGGLDHTVMEEFEGVVLESFTRAWSWVQWSPKQSLRINAYINPGEFVAYNTGAPRIGHGINGGTNISLQIAGNIQAEFNGNYSSLWEQDGSGMIYEGWIWRSVFRYNPNRFIQARLITQWNQFSSDYLIQPLLQYQPGPFTIYYIGSSTYAAPNQGNSTTQIFAKAQLTLRP